MQPPKFSKPGRDTHYSAQVGTPPAASLADKPRLDIG